MRVLRGADVSLASVWTSTASRAFSFVLFTALVTSLSASCASQTAARSDCATRAWSGSCKLRALTKVEDRELPMPYVVYEAIYTPQANAEHGDGNYTPAEVRLRFGAPAQYEFALQDHLKAQELVACQSPVAQGSCVPEGIVANVVPFDADHAAPVAPVHASGCAAIEAASEQERVNQSRNSGVVISERFAFAADSDALAPEATTTASAIAKRMRADPSLECVGLVGQIASGESPSLAEARAHAVKELLVSMGVDRGRLLTIALTSNVYGPGAKPLNNDADTRRVSLNVLLKTAPAPTP
jgi:outer membrane protein OmpA-like peptidoglycan-associated protein